jgi:hypothetical protein
MNAAPRFKYVESSVAGDGEPVVTQRDIGWEPLPNLPVARGQLSDLSSDEPRWHLSRLEAGAEVPIHATESIDYICVIAGTLELVLHGETIRLRPGDCVMQRGAEHGWRVVGDDPAIISAVILPSAA